MPFPLLPLLLIPELRDLHPKGSWQLAFPRAPWGFSALPAEGPPQSIRFTPSSFRDSSSGRRLGRGTESGKGSYPRVAAMCGHLGHLVHGTLPLFSVVCHLSSMAGEDAEWMSDGDKGKCFYTLSLLN